MTGIKVVDTHTKSYLDSTSPDLTAIRRDSVLHPLNVLWLGELKIFDPDVVQFSSADLGQHYHAQCRVLANQKHRTFVYGFLLSQSIIVLTKTERNPNDGPMFVQSKPLSFLEALPYLQWLCGASNEAFGYSPLPHIQSCQGQPFSDLTYESILAIERSCATSHIVYMVSFLDGKTSARQEGVLKIYKFEYAEIESIAEKEATLLKLLNKNRVPPCSDYRGQREAHNWQSSPRFHPHAWCGCPVFALNDIADHCA